MVEARSKNIIKLVEKKYKAVLIAPINENLPKYSNKLENCFSPISNSQIFGYATRLI
jgi:hypothetical protein|tara:strand:- start:213 stop:383 length:171 start_codon:yes stop_codon:yes gene_type:complete